MEYTGRGQGIYNTVAGSIGLASAVANGMGLNGLFGNNNVVSSEETAVTRHELNYVRELADKDHQIAQLTSSSEARAYTDAAIKGLSDQLAVKFNQIDQNLTSQSILNTQQTATMQCMQNNISQLMGMTQLIIPNGSVMPGWGNVTITPSGATVVKGAISSDNT